MLVQPEVVTDGPPSEEDITVVVRSIHAVRVGVPSGMQVEHLNMWIIKATREKKPERTRWEVLVSMAQLMFREGRVLAELAHTTIIIPPNGKG